jgi:hypothetical protein
MEDISETYIVASFDDLSSEIPISDIYNQDHGIFIWYFGKY